MDYFCGITFDVTSRFDIPGFFFFTSGASCLASFLHFPTIHRETSKSLKDLDIVLDIPGVLPIPPLELPKPFLDRKDKAYEYFLEASTQLAKSAGIIVNTFEHLEPRAIKAVSNGLCVPNNATPPVLCIGPLILPNDQRDGGCRGRTRNGVREEYCLKWLDSQPRKSVVFLCFGSLGLFSMEQLKEIAVGLERSGQRFLWVVRNPPNRNGAVSDLPLDSLLPEGFLDRNKERGLVVKQWAPQVAVLSHDSVGGFVTHCGWNSVLEAVCAGVPMVAWPLYAEQRFNRVPLVEEIKIALWMNESEDGFVSATEVEKRVSELMDSELGNSIRDSVTADKNEANAALSQGGSSSAVLTQLFESWN